MSNVLGENQPRVGSATNSVQPSIVTEIRGKEGYRRRGEPEIIKRTVFFQGMVYIIEEEIYSDSDNSSVYTSEDDFDDDKYLPTKM